MAKAGFKKRAYRKTKAFRHNVLGMFLIAVIVCVLLGVIIVKNKDMSQTIQANEASITQLNEQIEEETARTSEIEEEGAYMQSDEYYEKIAHEKIGLVYDNEVIYKEAE